jgi:hypothetical protein
MLYLALPETLGIHLWASLGDKSRMSTLEGSHEAQESGGPDALSNERNLHFG